MQGISKIFLSISSKFSIIWLTAGIFLYNSLLSIEAIAIIFPIPADFAESIPEIASSTTIHSCGSIPNFFAAF